MFAVDQIAAEMDAREWASRRVWTTGNRTIFVEWPDFTPETALFHAVILPQDGFDPVKVVDEFRTLAERDDLDPNTGQKNAQMSLDLPKPANIQS